MDSEAGARYSQSRYTQRAHVARFFAFTLTGVGATLHMPGMVHASIFNDMPGFPPALRSFYTHIVYFHSSSSVTNSDLDIKFTMSCPLPEVGY